MIPGEPTGIEEDFTCKKQKGGKLKERYIGPYTIIKVLLRGIYELASLSDKSKPIRATGAHLKPYVPSSPNSKTPSTDEHLLNETFTLSPQNDDTHSPPRHSIDQTDSLCFQNDDTHSPPCPDSPCFQNNDTHSPPRHSINQTDSPCFQNNDTHSPPRHSIDQTVSLCFQNDDTHSPPCHSNDQLNYTVSPSRCEPPDLNKAVGSRESFSILPLRVSDNHLVVEEDTSFLNSCIPVLPPPMPSLTVH